MKTIIILLISIFIPSQHLFAAPLKDCLHGKILTIKDSFPNNRVDVTKHFSLKSKDNACFGEVLEIRIISATKNSLYASFRLSDNTKKRIRLKTGGTAHFRNFSFKLLSSTHPQKAKLQAKYKAQSTLTFPVVYPATLCFLTSGPVCYLTERGPVTGAGLCSNQTSPGHRTLYEGNC